jgi:signal transduction histidine kinase
MAEAIGLAIVPGVITLALLPRARAGWAQVLIIYSWIAFAGAAAGASGGFSSPLAAAFALAPAFAARIGERRLTGEAVFFAGIGFVVAGALAPSGAGLALGPLPALGAGAAMLAAGGLIAGLRAGMIAAPAEERHVLASQKPLPTEADAMIAAHRRRAAELAHEVRTPLNHILGFADVMRQRLFGPMHDRYGEYVELIHKSGRNLLDLVNGLLDISRIEAGKYPLEIETFDFRHGAEEVLQLARDQAGAKSIGLSLDADETLIVNADARALRQILTNLVANALKFTPEGGAVIVHARTRGRELTIEVQDNGPGIPAAERARLGIAYERGANAGEAEGFGLGLSLVRAFAALHGGQMSFHDAPGGGALVRVVLPVAKG